MIRHRQQDSFLLITQDDHARLSGTLAGHFGNDRFDSPGRPESTLKAISLHDSGWPLHDNTPTLNRQRLPLHVLETPIDIATTVWTESARLASEADPYAGLLVSIHVLNLSAMSAAANPGPTQRSADRRDYFLLNQFQQDQIELQAILRHSVGLRNDIPLRLGLARDIPATDPNENQLAFNYGVLKLADRISLDACFSEHTLPPIGPLFARPGKDRVEMEEVSTRAGAVVVAPWPFSIDRIELDIPCRRVPAAPFDNEPAFQESYRTAPVKSFRVDISKG